jgi:hypothetical protein
MYSKNTEMRHWKQADRFQWSVQYVWQQTNENYNHKDFSTAFVMAWYEQKESFISV